MGNVPNLRFPEFCGEWETIKVSELLDFYSTNSLSWEQLDYSNGKIKNLHYGLIHKGVPTMVDVACDSLPYIKEESMLKSFTLFKEGDVAFADASEDTNDVAKAIEVVNCDNQQIVSGLHTIHGRDNSNRTVIGYKGYAFASDSFHKQIRRIAQGTKVFSISVRNFDEAYIGIPSKEEHTECCEINQLLTYEQPTAYIVTNDEYSTDTTLIPVLTANKGFVLGYTDEDFGIYQKGECIIFDDFTMDAKYVSFPFKVKSSAIKMLTAKPNVNLRFMFEYLSYLELKSEEHKRHYISEIASLVVELPSKEMQNKIASLMTSLDNKLALEENTSVRYEDEKQYLLSQMFI